MTYLNCYAMLEQMRYGLNEHSAALMAGTVSGAHFNSRLLFQLNGAQRYLFALLKKRMKEHFRVTNSSLAVTSSVITLPDDFGVLELLRDSDGRQIYPISSKERRRTASAGSDQFYYREGNYLKLDKAGVTGTVTLIYFKRCPELTYGQAQAESGALSLVMQSNAKTIVDYYNGVKIENVTDEVTDTISDYTAARVATVGTTWAEDEWYGTVSILPEEFHQFIVDLALLRERKDNPLVQDKPRSVDYQIFQDALSETITAMGHGAEDEDPSDIFEDFDPLFYGGGYMDLG